MVRTPKKARVDSASIMCVSLLEDAPIVVVESPYPRLSSPRCCHTEWTSLFGGELSVSHAKDGYARMSNAAATPTTIFQLVLCRSREDGLRSSRSVYSKLPMLTAESN